MIEPAAKASPPSAFPSRLAADDVVAILRAAGEPTRLRILRLLAAGDLTVKDLTTILGQSQPRISRHLKLLVEAGLIDRFPEGAWAYYRPNERDAARQTLAVLDRLLDPADASLARDGERLTLLRRDHAEEAAVFFARHAGEWDRIRSLHIDESLVETAILEAVGAQLVGHYLDLGTGTGRLLELLDGRYQRGLGVDLSHDMLAAARAELAARGIHAAQLRHGDLYALQVPQNAYDLVTIHQVLHYLDEPVRAIREAARVMRPGGRLIVVDFAPHGLEFLREGEAHRRLGFAHAEIARAMEQAGLVVDTIRDLPPPGDAPSQKKLTVTLWVGHAPRATAPREQIQKEHAL